MCIHTKYLYIYIYLCVCVCAPVTGISIEGIIGRVCGSGWFRVWRVMLSCCSRKTVAREQELDE